MKESLICTIVIFIITGTVYGQHSISGKVTDSITGEPIAFSHIYLKNYRHLGTASNELGEFAIRVFIDNKDTLVISSIAHHDYYLSIEDSREMDFPAGFKLSPKQYLLEPVEVRAPSETAKNLVKKAIDDLKKNYNPRRHVLHAFYREFSIDPKDKVFQSLAEADVLISDRGILRDNERVKVSLTELRRSDDLRDSWFRKVFRRISDMVFQPSNGIYSTYNSHFLKPAQGNAGWFDESFFDNTDFYLNKQIVDKNDTISVIGFVGKTAHLRNNNELGIIHINHSDNAILRVEFEYKYSDDFHLQRLQTFQKHEDGYYYPGIIRIHSNYITNMLMYVYDVSNERRELRENFWTFLPWRILDRKDNIFELDYTYNEDFWENYNAIQLVPIDDKLIYDMERHRSLMEQFHSPE